MSITVLRPPSAWASCSAAARRRYCSSATGLTRPVTRRASTSGSGAGARRPRLTACTTRGGRSASRGNGGGGGAGGCCRDVCASRTYSLSVVAAPDGASSWSRRSTPDEPSHMRRALSMRLIPSQPRWIPSVFGRRETRPTGRDTSSPRGPAAGMLSGPTAAGMLTDSGASACPREPFGPATCARGTPFNRKSRQTSSTLA